MILCQGSRQIENSVSIDLGTCINKMLSFVTFLQTLQMFDNLMYELSTAAKELTSQNTELCSTMRNLMQASPMKLAAKGMFTLLIDFYLSN